MLELTKKNTFDSASQHYLQLLEEAKRKIQITRIQIAKSANKEQFNLYWWLGERIVEAQKKFGSGKSVVEQLAKDLRHSFPDTTYGFSARNLWEMRRFHSEYKNYPILQQLVAEIPWGHNLVILSKIKDMKAREYYINAVKEQGWTRNVLVMQIDSQAYKRHLLIKKQHNFEKALPQHLAEQADRTMKDIYMLDTLGLTKPVLETEIENRIVSKIKTVMLELGYGFTFIGNQYRIVAEGNEYFIDLLFYNRRLKSLVAMELKRGKFEPEYAGKMNFYLNLLDDFVREPDENPSIGIILCSERNKFEVEYALRGLDKPVGVSEFRLTRTLPAELCNKLPNADELESEILKELGMLDVEKMQ
jgi:predicted nuclease of restriction endonuclease-like (RecB) superfamily